MVCCLSVDLFEYLRIDDPVGAVSVHGVCGIWGTLSLGLFATGQYGAPGQYGADTSTTVRGLFYGGGSNQLVAQVIVELLHLRGDFRLFADHDVQPQGARRPAALGGAGVAGMDITEHGGPAYPELVPLDAADPRRDLLREPSTALMPLPR